MVLKLWEAHALTLVPDDCSVIDHSFRNDEYDDTDDIVFHDGEYEYDDTHDDYDDDDDDCIGVDPSKEYWVEIEEDIQERLAYEVT